MRKTLFTLLLVSALGVSAEDMQIRMTQEQIDNLAIKVGPLLASQQVPLLYAPARVVVPANRELLISSPQPGLLAQLHVNIGDKVEKGQILAQINSPELVALQQQFLTATSEQNLSAKEYQRDKSLSQEGVIAERRWQETQALHASKSAKTDEAKQMLTMAGMSASEVSALTKNRHLNSQLNVRAPISGVVLERMATVGARLDMQAPLYRIADLSELWLEINIPQQRLESLRIGDRVEGEDLAMTGKITLLGQSVNPENQTVAVRAVVDGQSAQLRVGQNLNVRILQDSRNPAFRVPNSAIAQNAGHAYVFVRNANGFAVTEIKVLGRHDYESLISAMLKGDEQIAIQGSVALKANWLGLGGGE
jgi:cobalt-zinc-cadmium efflux system membrane fusion protein